MCEQVTSLSVHQFGVAVVATKWSFVSQDSGKDIFFYNYYLFS